MVMPLANYLAAYGRLRDDASGGEANRLRNQQSQQQIQQAQQEQQAQALAATILPLLFRTQGPGGAGPATPGMTGGADGGRDFNAIINGAPSGPAAAPAPMEGSGTGPNIAPMGSGGGAAMGGPGMPSGFDVNKLMQLLQQQGGGQPGPVQFGAAQDVLKMMQPYNNMEQKYYATMLNNMTRQNIAGENNDTRRDVAGAGRTSREGIAADNRDASGAEKELADTRALLGKLLDNGKGPGNPEYDAMKKDYEAQKKQLSLKREAPAGGKAASRKGGEIKASPDAPTQADLEYTAKQHKMTVDEVKAELGVE